MDLELQITHERKNSVSDFSCSDSLPSIDSLGPDSLTGWTNQKPTIPGLCSEKPAPSFCIQNSKTKSNNKPPKRPSTISTLPCNDEPSPRRSHLRLKSRLKKFRGQSAVGKEEEQTKNWKTTDVFNNLRNKFRSLKTKSTSFSKEPGDREARIAWLQANADQTYGNPYVVKTDNSKLLLKPGEGWAALRANSFASKGIDDLDISQMSQISGKYIHEGRVPANITLYPIGGPKKKQRNYSLNNANLSTLRKTFMGISMIAAQGNNTPVFKEPVPTPTLDSSLLLSKKPRGSVQHRELYTEEPLGHLGLRNSIENKPLIHDIIEVKKPAFHARKLSAQRAKAVPLSEEKPNSVGTPIKVENEKASIDVKDKPENKPKIMQKKDEKVKGLRGTRGVPKSTKSPKPKMGNLDVIPKAFEVVGGKLGNRKSFY